MTALVRSLFIVSFLLAGFGLQEVRAQDIGDMCNEICKRDGMYFDPYGYSFCEGDYCDCACVP